MELPIYVNGIDPAGEDAIFSKPELNFLNFFGINPNESEKISGEAVWKLYELLIDRTKQNKKENKGFDLQEKIDFKKLQSIMSKFTFSLLKFARDYQDLQLFGEERFGYLYLSGWDDDREEGKPYSFQNGLNNEVFKTSNFI